MCLDWLEEESIVTSKINLHPNKTFSQSSLRGFLTYKTQLLLYIQIGGPYKFFLLFNERKCQSLFTGISKGQFFSELIFGVFKSPKKPTKFLTDFCPICFSCHSHSDLGNVYLLVLSKASILIIERDKVKSIENI